MKRLYLKILQYLCRKELKRISDAYPNTLDELIAWHDYMALECINSETKGKDRILGVCVGTANWLDKLKDDRWIKNG